MPALVFADNDILLKLAAYDLLQETLELFRATVTDVKYLPDFLHRLKRRPQNLERQCTPAGMTRLLTFLASATQTSAVTSDVPPALLGIQGLDVGELLLVADALKDPHSLMITGDKKALKALASAPAAKSTYVALTGRVACLEGLVRAHFVGKGFPYLLTRVNAAPAADAAIAAAFGVGATARSAKMHLDRLIRNLEDDIGHGWLRALA